VHKTTVCILGAGEVGTACALRLFRAGFALCMVEKYPPTDIYFHHNFSAALFSGKKTINNITARTLSGSIEAGNVAPEIALHDFLSYQLANREIALLNESQSKELKNFSVDYIVKSCNEPFAKLESYLEAEAKGIVVGRDENTAVAHYTVANDILYHGRVIYPFLSDSMETPVKMEARQTRCLQIKAPLEGVFSTFRRVDDFIREKEELGRINDLPILSPASGHISGLLNSGLMVGAKTVFAEVNTAKDFVSALSLPPKAFALAGGVLEAICYDLHL